MVDAKEAAKRVLSGDVIAIPTDTVYGLAADLYSTEGIAKIYRLKKRELSKSLVLFIASKDILPRIPVKVSKKTSALINQFWPGSLTVILELTDEAKLLPFWKMRAASDGTLAIRIPANPQVVEFMTKYKLGLLTTSANLSGHFPCKTESEIHEQFGSEFPILEGEMRGNQIASTIVKCVDDAFVVIREGDLMNNREFLKYLEV